MRTSTFISLQTFRLDSLLNIIKVVLSAALLVFAFYNFSLQHWFVLGLFIVGMLAISARLDNITPTTMHPAQIRRVNSSDGGTFHKQAQPDDRQNTQPVVRDGGSFERSAATTLSSRS